MRAELFYMLASHSHRQGTLYTGVTANHLTRIGEHRNGTFKGFTADYDVKRLVWSEQHETIGDAIAREKRIKKWNWAWKINLIEGDNQNWDDLAVPLFGFETMPAYDREATATKRCHPRADGDPRSPMLAAGGAALVSGIPTLGPRLRGDDKRS